MKRRRKGNSTRWLLALLIPASSLLLLLACNSSSLDDAERGARNEITRTFPGWKVVTAQDLTNEDFEAWSAKHPAAAPGFTSGDYFGDGKKCFAALLTNEDERGKVARLVVMSLEPSGRFVTYSVFSEVPVEEMPAIFTSQAGDYEVYIDDEPVLVPVEGVVYTHPGETAKLFFWNGTQFVDVEVGVE